VSSKTMESRIVPGLFFAGEILDIDGESGGYNLQAAFSTGFFGRKIRGRKGKNYEIMTSPKSGLVLRLEICVRSSNLLRSRR